MSEVSEMECQQVREQLNILSDGERLSSGRWYVEVVSHCMGCVGCRAAWRRMKRDRRVSRRLPAVPPPAALRERVLASLPPAPGMSIPPVPVRKDRRTLSLLVRASVAGGLVVALIAFSPWKKDQPLGVAVEAAVQRANTWHLRGWKLQGGRKIPWEIWGRREPFFYREQLGDELNFDDGTQRVRLIPTGVSGQRLALRLASGPAPSDQWSRWLTMGTGWRQLTTVLQETRDQVLLRGGMDGGMQGPYSVASDYFRVHKGTWLPVQWEYRLHWSNSKAPERVIDTLQAEYDVPLPAAVTGLRLPAGVRLADTLGVPTDPSMPTENVQRANGLTVQAQALAMDPDGNILVRVRSWLGNMKLGAAGTGSINDVETNHRYRSVNMLQRPPPTVETGYRTKDGLGYVPFSPPRLFLSLANGDVLMLLTPLEPRPAGTSLPRSLVVDLQVTPQVYTQAGSSVLFDQEFTWTLPLPERAAPIRIDDFLPPGHRGRVRFAPGAADDSTVAGNIAAARAGAYEIARRYERAIYWHRQGLAAVPPFTNNAQIRRLDLANTYAEAGDLPHAAATYREVIRISHEHPKTWNYYAYLAQGGLRGLKHPRRHRQRS
jgi:hypothetical protein